MTSQLIPQSTSFSLAFRQARFSMGDRRALVHVLESGFNPQKFMPWDLACISQEVQAWAIGVLHEAGVMFDVASFEHVGCAGGKALLELGYWPAMPDEWLCSSPWVVLDRCGCWEHAVMLGFRPSQKDVDDLCTTASCDMQQLFANESKLAALGFQPTISTFEYLHRGLQTERDTHTEALAATCSLRQLVAEHFDACTREIKRRRLNDLLAWQEYKQVVQEEMAKMQAAESNFGVMLDCLQDEQNLLRALRRKTRKK